MPGGKRLGVMFGSDAESGRVFPGQSWMGAGTTDVRLLGPADDDDFIRVHIPGNFPRLKTKPELEPVGTLLNLITDAEVNPKVLGFARKLLETFTGRVLNHPDAVIACTRDRVAARLSGIEGMMVPMWWSR